VRPSLRPAVRDNVEAGLSLRRLAGPLPRKLPRWRTAAAQPPQQLLRWYQEAERRFGVEWEVLAAVNLVETGFGRLRNLSSAGARGPMQFIPSTWRAYGLGGDIDDAHDAILGAANYLHASGAPHNYRRALFAYNNSGLYVDAILRYARQMRRDARRYYGYWSWQVFVRGRDGRDRRLTGPR
jgi:soluble lytic murein transglycosylase-like protein